MNLNRFLVVGVLLAIVAPMAAAAPPGSERPQDCLDDADPANCLVMAVKCILREQVHFLYDCWGILGP